ncbi:acyl-CoA dehydrogenase family protein [Achromobacter aloeverae]|uniref:Pimeloyl-CoA dehydrogenase small subunit n=1 Tax=Achromobacter aloeverae TaxID=1750518 RepID=A0A4Q1HFU1_9BURK|nr:acyl-CoA dehydrogenase family protein [Achromobacter aloeverae]RXN85983.1 pimeloyl-CoA dehydrogenase small subunit [Achromobacter aloeverae]
MNLEHTEDRRMLADTLNRFISERYGIETRNRIAYGEEGHSPALYARFAELGAIAALFPEEAGGLGGRGHDIGVVFECLGRGLVAEPLLGALVVGQALLHAGSPAQRGRLDDIMGGGCLAALAHDEPGSHYELENVAVTARRDGESWVIDGVKGVVGFGDKADLLLVSARTAGHPGDTAGISLFLVPGDAAGLATRGYRRFEGGRAAELAFNGVRVGDDALLGRAGAGFDVLERVSGYGILALCAEALGAMDVAKEQTLAYLRIRKQFGVPIGSFQALQHRMADLLLEVEQARSAVINAAAAIDSDDRVARERVLSAAKYSTGYIGTLVAQESIQLHGGIGMTWELPLAHYAKRLVMIDHQFGDEDHHLARYVALAREDAAASAGSVALRA